MENIIEKEKKDILDEFYRYLSFWYLFLISTLFLVSVSFLYIRYTPTTFEGTAIIEIIDKSQDRDMSLPTNMTIFNRSMVNLDNEIGVISSFKLNSKIHSSLKSNVKYYTQGRIKTSENHKSEWFQDYELDFLINTDLINKYSEFKLIIEKNKLDVHVIDSKSNDKKIFQFNSLNTNLEKHNLPFQINIKKHDSSSNVKILKLFPFGSNVLKNISRLEVEPSSLDSDQLIIKYSSYNKLIISDYINTLISEFDKDGINDRQLEYKRTIQFVETRSIFLRDEVRKIELEKQNFKVQNKLTDLKYDATISVNQQYNYNAELFNSRTQLDLISILENTIKNGNKFQIIPIEIGIENSSLNSLIENYNNLLRDRERFSVSAGSKNSYLLRVEKELTNLRNSVLNSIKNFQNSLEIKISNLTDKEKEFDLKYQSMPENEKILREINRELEIKESLFLLLLQKKEEAAINFAVIKPSIKIVDYAIINNAPLSPKPQLIYFTSILAGIFLPFLILYIYFFLDNKIHTKEQLTKLLNTNIPIVAEIPFLKKISANNETSVRSRSLISEGVRMLMSNLRFTFIDSDTKKNNVIIFTSSVKGEGKTLVSVNTALGLSNDLKNKKTILIGSDLRNPQVHKSFGVDKSQKGVTEIIYKSDSNNYREYLKRFNNLDVLFSGAIPPNPTPLLSSDEFKKLIHNIKNDYDYVIIDSAPCLLVADTLQYVQLADSIVYLLRANYTNRKIVDFINEIYTTKKIENINVVLNAVGNSASYGYKYGYQYGSKYHYKYGYNYGYGYGYAQDDKQN